MSWRAWRSTARPLIVVDFGTATNFDVVNARGEFVGGAIAPGLMLAAEALVSRAARLSRVEIVRPKDAIGRNTVTNIQSGVVYGYAGLVDGLVERMRRELDGDVRVVATGGSRSRCARSCQSLQEVNAEPAARGAAHDLGAGESGRCAARRLTAVDTRRGAHPYTQPLNTVCSSEAVLYIRGLGGSAGPRRIRRMGMWVGRGRKARAAYGFDDIALVPGALTINPNEVDISWELCGRRFEIPIIAAAMDGVVSPALAIEMGRLGGLAVLNLEGIFSRYENPDAVLDRITSASLEEATKIIQGIYGEPIKEELIHKRISEIKKGGGPVVVSSIPQRAERFAKIAEEAGADFFVVQSTVTTARHVATEYTPVDLKQLKKHLSIPLIVGNVVTYEACLELMETGVDALLIGVGPGAACTSREVLGARRAPGHRHRRLRGGARLLLQADRPLRADHHRRRHDDGRRHLQGARLRRRRGHDRLRLRARQGGARPRLSLGHGDAALEPAARDAHPRRASPARSSRSSSGPPSPRTARSTWSARSAPAWARSARADIRELQQTELIIAPSIKTEGKVFQRAQKLGAPR